MGVAQSVFLELSGPLVAAAHMTVVVVFVDLV